MGYIHKLIESMQTMQSCYEQSLQMTTDQANCHVHSIHSKDKYCSSTAFLSTYLAPGDELSALLKMIPWEDQNYALLRQTKVQTLAKEEPI